MDRAYLQDAFDRLEIASFADDMEAIANHCFGDTRVSLSEEQQKIEHRILSGAVYGTTEQKNSNTLERRMHDGKNVRTVKFRMFFEKIFPDRAFMSGWYPWLKKSSALLPAAWVTRGVLPYGQKAAGAQTALSLCERTSPAAERAGQKEVRDNDSAKPC